MKAKVLIPTLGIATVLGLGALGVSAVKADDTTSYPPFIQSLAERFGLNQDEVQTFFEEQRQERQEERQQAREERLEQAVTDGVITEEQKQAIEEKQQQMWQEREQERQQHQEEMQAWFEEQGIDQEALREYGGFGGHRGGPGPMGPMGMGSK